MKKKCYIIGLIITLSLVTGGAISALDYQSNVGLAFTFNPTISISVSGDLSIDALSPGSFMDSNIVTINASSNNITGFSLYANVGNSTHTNPSYNNTNLNHSNGTNTFTSLSTNKTTLSSFDENSNTWGYSYCLLNNDCSLSSNWISGDYDSNNGVPDTGYNGLPLYNSGNGIKLVNTNTNPSSTIQFKIGARANVNQASGTYTNVINFIATANPNPTVTFYDAFLAEASKPDSTITKYNGYYKMQDMTTDICNAVDQEQTIDLIDIRDNNTYQVTKINSQCWMTQNLRYLGDTGSSAGTMTIGGNNSNVESKSITLYSLDSSDAQDFGAYSNHCDSTNGYNYACVYDSGSTSTGVWYNFYAASAGTISGSSNSTAATSDICPAGWHLPSGPNTTANTDYNKLVGNTTSGWQPATAGIVLFDGVGGSSYYNGSLTESLANGHWWSASYLSSFGMYALYYGSGDGWARGDGEDARSVGYFVRCVRSS